MNKEKFSAIIGLIVPQVIKLMCDNYNQDETTAINDFYTSKVYEVLEDENTKVWHFSPLTLFNMYDEEKRTGSFIFPEET